MKQNKLKQSHILGFIFLIVVCFTTSCIPNEKVIYIQNKDLSDQLKNDSLIPLERIDYKLQPNDILLINFYSRETEEVVKFYPLFARPNLLTAGNQGGGGQNQQLMDPYIIGYNVDINGDIEINALGRVRAAGLTTTELKYEIENQIREKDGINDILVGVKLRGISYTIFGEVLSPGPNVVQEYEFNILQAIANAGDLTLNADRANVLILRQYPDGTRVHEIDVTDRAFIATEFWNVQPDDIIYVPPLKIREIGAGANALQNLSLIVSVISSTTLIVSLLTRF